MNRQITANLSPEIRALIEAVRTHGDTLCLLVNTGADAPTIEAARVELYASVRAVVREEVGVRVLDAVADYWQKARAIATAEVFRRTETWPALGLEVVAG